MDFPHCPGQWSLPASSDALPCSGEAAELCLLFRAFLPWRRCEFSVAFSRFGREIDHIGASLLRPSPETGVLGPGSSASLSFPRCPHSACRLVRQWPPGLTTPQTAEHAPASALFLSMTVCVPENGREASGPPDPAEVQRTSQTRLENQTPGPPSNQTTPDLPTSVCVPSQAARLQPGLRVTLDCSPTASFQPIGRSEPQMVSLQSTAS